MQAILPGLVATLRVKDSYFMDQREIEKHEHKLRLS